MSSVPTLWSDSRASRLRRERPAICTHATQERATETRMGSGVPAGGRLTLERLLESVWEGLRAGGTAECPVCRGQMRRPTAEMAARCGSCGTAVS